jgi:hypothetical protein
MTSTTTLAVASTTLSITLNDQQREAAMKIASSTALATMAPQQVVMFGTERQRELGVALDNLLDLFTKGNSPLLFELFDRLKKGVDGAKIEELEAQIRTALTKRWYEYIFGASLAKRVKRANEMVNSAIKSRTTTLRDLMRGMEGQIQDEVQRLIGDLSQLDTLGHEYEQNVEQFAVWVEAGRQILTQARDHKQELEIAARSGDPLAVQRLRDFERKLQIFENRLLVLETAYVKAPAQLESIGLASGAALSTLSETANSATEEFNDIKTALIQLAVSYQIQSVQTVNAARRELRATLQKHGLNTLESVAIAAARAAGDNRLEDAGLLVTFARGLKSIGDKVTSEVSVRNQKFAQAREILIEAQAAISNIPSASESF